MEIGRDAFPALYLAADRSSLEGQATYRRLILVELATTVSGALLAAVGAFATALHTELTVVAAAAFIAAMATKVYNRQAHYDQRWFDGRAVAETVKSQTWRFMMRVPPYDDDHTAEEAFAQVLLATMHARAAVPPSEADGAVGAEITPPMRATRALGLPDRRDTYVTGRLRDQTAWYRSKAVGNARSARRWFWLALAGQGLAATMAISSIVQPTAPWPSLIGLFAALAAAVTAWSQVGRHDELSKSYALAYQELLVIGSLAERVASEDGLRRVVRDAEGAISREHTMWMAKRGDPLPDEVAAARPPAPPPA